MQRLSQARRRCIDVRDVLVRLDRSQQAAIVMVHHLTSRVS